MAPSIEPTGLIAPYGGELVDLVAPPERFAEPQGPRGPTGQHSAVRTSDLRSRAARDGGVLTA